MRRPLQLAAFYHQLATLLEAGVPVIRALETLERSAPNRRLRAASAATRARITGGDNLTGGFEAHPALFPPLHRELVRVGEQSGTLERQLRRLARLLEDAASARREVLTAVLYPLLVLHLAVLLGPLPRLAATQDLAAYGGEALGALVTLYGAAGLFWWMLRQIARDQSALAPVDRLAMALPMAGKVHRDFSLGRFFAALGALLNAGIAILEALPRAAAACGSALLANAARAAVPLLKQGESLTVIFADIVPPDALSILSTGQESGRLDDALARLERHFFEEGRQRLRTLAEWLPKLIYLAVVLWVAWQIIRMALGYRRMLSGLLDD